MVAAALLLGVVAIVVLPRLTSGVSPAKKAACEATRARIELQAQLYYRETGTWPQADLANIGADADYFPDGLPTCPVDGSSYSFNTATQRITGHAH